MTSDKPEPLYGDAPDQIPLPNAPLEIVLAQVRYPKILAISQAEKIIGFQEAIRDEYPNFTTDHIQQISISEDQGSTSPLEKIWRFSSMDNSWRVSLSTNFVALETSKYESRQDFCGRFSKIISSFESTFKPKIIQRVGVRYIDRIRSPEINEIQDMIKRDILGVYLTEFGKNAEYSLTNVVSKVEEGTLQARWGHLPANATFDPAALKPIDVESWIMDLDVFSQMNTAFSSEDCVNRVRAYATRAYAVFRWMIEDKFIEIYGGEVDGKS